MVTEQNYVEEAEKVIKELKGKKDRNGRDIPMVTTSKIRNLLAMTADIYNEVMGLNENTLPENIVARIEYLKVRFIYEAGRDEKSVKPFIETAHILEQLKSIKNSKKEYILFNRYMEALVAFHKYYGGKD